MAIIDDIDYQNSFKGFFYNRESENIKRVKSQESNS
jgi:hypothetical protein